MATHAKHMSAKRGNPSPMKAREILKHGEVRGHTLTPKQQRFMGARMTGQPIKRAR